MYRAVLIFVLACSPASTSSPRPSSPDTQSPTTQQPTTQSPTTTPESLAGFCGAPTTPPCPTLDAHLRELRAKDCPQLATSHNVFGLRACGAFSQVDSDYGIVGYSRYFDTKGTLVGAVAHVYEYRTERAFGSIPTCEPGAAVPVCTTAP